MDWARMLAYITGTVGQELLLRNEYLAAENRILKAQIKGRLLLSDAEKKTLADIGHGLGREALEDVANAAKPDTIKGWYRKLVARKFDGSKSRRYPGRPRIDPEVEQLVVRMAKENTDWGYDRIVGALANLGYTLSDQTVGNILRRNGIPPAHERKRTTTWAEFIRAHLSVLAATDFFTVEVLTLRGLVTYYVLFVKTMGIKPCRTAYRSPWQHGVAERWIGSCRREMLDHVIVFGRQHFIQLMRSYLDYYHDDRCYLALDKDTPMGRVDSCKPSSDPKIVALPRVGGLHHRYVRRDAA